MSLYYDMESEAYYEDQEILEEMEKVALIGVERETLREWWVKGLISDSEREEREQRLDKELEELI